MNMKYTIEELKNIILDKRSGMKPNMIAKKYGRTVTAIRSLTSDYKLFLERGKTDKPGLTAKFTEINTMILNNIPLTPPSEVKEQSTQPITQVAEDHYALFKKAQEQWEIAQIAFIQREVASRVQEEKQKLIEAEKTIERLQRENDEYQKAFLVAQNSNWIDTLKKRLSNGNTL